MNTEETPFTWIFFSLIFLLETCQFLYVDPEYILSDLYPKYFILGAIIDDTVLKKF